MRETEGNLDGTEAIEPLDADLLYRLWRGQHIIPVPTFPTPTGGQLGTHSLAGCTMRLDFSEGQLELAVGAGGAGQLERLNLEVQNVPIRLAFSDGWELTGELAGVSRQQTHFKVSEGVGKAQVIVWINRWRFVSKERPRFLIGKLIGPTLEDNNLAIVRRSTTEFTRRCIAVDTPLRTYVVSLTRNVSAIVFSLPEGRATFEAIWATLMALEYAFGCPLELDLLTAYQINLRECGISDVGYRQRHRASVAKRSPVPSWRELGQIRCLQVPLCELVARKLAEDGESSPLYIALTGYSDSLSGHIHGRYLFAQVALEAFCKRALKQHSSPLVKSETEWKNFVSAMVERVQELARDGKSANALISKLHAAMNPGSSSLVQSAFAERGIRLPRDMVKEIKGRNRSAHEFLMADEASMDVEEVAQRLSVIQTTLAASIALYVGYKGPLAGVTSQGAGPVKNCWWPHQSSSSAATQFVAEPGASASHSGEPI